MRKHAYRRDARYMMRPYRGARALTIRDGARMAARNDDRERKGHGEAAAARQARLARALRANLSRRKAQARARAAHAAKNQKPGDRDAAGILNVGASAPGAQDKGDKGDKDDKDDKGDKGEP